MINFINIRFSVSTRLGMIGSLFVVPILFLAYVFIQQSLSDISFSAKEVEGTRYLAEIWLQFAKTAATGDASQAEFPDRARYDALFETKDLSQSFLNAKGLIAKIDAGKILIAAVADNSNLTLDTDLDSFYLMAAETVKMPTITSAALDMAAAASEPVTSPSRNADFAVAVDRLKLSLSGAISSVATARKYNSDGVTDKFLAAPSLGLQNAADGLLVEVRALIQGGGDPANFSSAQRALQAETSSFWGLTNTELTR